MPINRPYVEPQSYTESTFKTCCVIGGVHVVLANRRAACRRVRLSAGLGVSYGSHEMTSAMIWSLAAIAMAIVAMTLANIAARRAEKASALAIMVMERLCEAMSLALRSSAACSEAYRLASLKLRTCSTPVPRSGEADKPVRAVRRRC